MRTRLVPHFDADSYGRRFEKRRNGRECNISCALSSQRLMMNQPISHVISGGRGMEIVEITGPGVIVLEKIGIANGVSCAMIQSIDSIANALGKEGERMELE